MKKLLLTLLGFMGIMFVANAQIPYTYTVETFETGAFPLQAAAPTTLTRYDASTGSWGVYKAYLTTSTDPCSPTATTALRFKGGDTAYLISPLLAQGAAVLTFNDNRTNRTFTYYTSTDNGNTWSAGTNITSPGTSCNTITITFNSAIINKIKIGSAITVTNDMGVDNLLITPFTINPPIVTTSSVSQVMFTTANSGGTVIAEAGAPVTSRGVCWSTTANPTIANSITTNGTGLGNYTSALTGLLPATTYHVRAYATNSAGTSYGGDSVFTTPVATPTIIVNPNALSFGAVSQGVYSSELSYTISAVYLTTATGSITINAPAGYVISTTSGSGYTTSISLPYTSNTLTPTIIYVRFFPSSNGAFNGNITNAGGGAPSISIPVSGLGTLLSPTGNLTNMGIDFWTGFGYHSRMSNNDNSDGAYMSLYISAKQATSVRVSIPGVADPSFPRIIPIAANTSVEVTNFPRGELGVRDNPNHLPDSRLYFTGITPRGIHVESMDGVPVAVYEHTYGTDAAGAMLLFPTNTWGATYNVLSLGGTSNSGVPNSFFFVMAAEDNTSIEITPTADIIDSSSATIFGTNTPAANIRYPANIPFTITLQKGQIFNAMSRINGSGSSGVGQDLTGSLIRSVDCNKKIAVWAGNGRTFVNSNGCSLSSGSDNMLQQMFPRVAWGTKYVTTPTKTMEYGIYKICVLDPTTNVWVNNPTHTTPLTGLVNNFYYQIENNTPNLIESDKPIMLIQYIITGNCKNNTFGNNGSGDPEMIILSPVQQAINNISVFSAGKSTIATSGASFINVVIKNSGISSFRLDPATNTTNMVDTGRSSYIAGTPYSTSPLIPIAAAFLPHPNAVGYSYARFRVSSSQYHNLVSDSGFNAIAYGMASGESYGYNAGTAIKNLSAVIKTLNPYDTISGSKTCKNNPTTIQIAVPYLASSIDSIKWDATNNTNIAPNGITTIVHPTPVSTYVDNEITYNVYRMPSQLVFKEGGVYRVYATIFGTFSSECGNSQVIPIDMEVVTDTAKFNFIATGCSSTLVNFRDTTRPYAGGNIIKWIWDFGDATSSNVQNPPQHNYPAIGVYNAHLRVINNIGCYSDTTRVVDLTGGIKAKFGIAPNDTICFGTSVVFSDSSVSTGTSGNIVEWNWHFGDGTSTIATTNANQTHAYNVPGRFIDTLQVKTANGCLSNLYVDTIVVNATPQAFFSMPSQGCFADTVQFTDTSKISFGNIVKWHWNFGDPASGANDSSNLQNPKHLFSTASTYQVSLYVESGGGCTSSLVNHSITINAKPTAAFSFTAPTCAKSPVTFNDNSIPNSGNIVEWQWDFGDGHTETKFTSNSFTHIYDTGGIYYAILKVKTDKGCYSDTSKRRIVVNATPLASFNLPGNICLPNALASFVNTTSINDGTLSSVTYSWDFGDATSASSSAQHTYTSVGPFNVKLTATSINGCIDDSIIVFNTVFAQPTANITGPAEACLADSVLLTGSVTTPGSSVASWTWHFNDPTSGVNDSSHLQNPKHRWNSTGLYNVTLQTTSAVGCSSNVANHSIKINIIPVADFTYSAIHCQGDSIAFTDASIPNATSITQWSWNFGDGTTFIQTSPGLIKHKYDTAKVYHVQLTVVSSSGCTSLLKDIPVTINPLPVSKFSFNNTCFPSGTAVFTNQSTIVSGSVNQLLWDFGDATSPVIAASPATHVYTSGGAYNVTLTAISALGCRKDTLLQIKVFDAPTASFSTFNNIDSLCSNKILSINNTSIVNGYGSVDSVVIFWDYLSNVSNTTIDAHPILNHSYTQAYPVFGTPATKNYRVLIKAYSGGSCEGQYYKDIVLKATPKVLFNAISSVCEEVPSITLNTASDVFGNNGIGIYSGAGISNSPVLIPSQAGQGQHQIQYIFTSNNNCADTGYNNITIFPTPQVDYGGNKNVLEGEAVTLNPISISGTGFSFNWTPATFLNNSSSSAPICTPNQDIAYSINILSSNGCKSNEQLTVKVLRDFIVPNTFTPNGDGINDKWTISNINFYPGCRIEVFNRYGQIIFDTKNNLGDWDGTYNGSPVPQGTYYYIIDLNGTRPSKKGYVTVIR